MIPDLVSVIIPIWNNRAHVRDALAAIFDQTHAAVELILVDDGSSDGSGELARRMAPNAVFIRQSNRGTSAARNRGIVAANGRYLAFCDADDRWLPRKLTKQLEALDATPALTASICLVDEFVDQGEKSAPLRQPYTRVVGFLPSALLIKREAFDAIGPFDEDLQIASWAAWWTRYEELDGNFGIVDEVLLQRRLHAHNAGVLLRSSVREYLTVADARIRHHRQG